MTIEELHALVTFRERCIGLSADLQEALHQATMLTAAGATGLQVEVFARAVATGRFTETDLALLRDRGIEFPSVSEPEPKPWHDAKPGEVWVVKTKHNDQERPVFVNSDGDFENAEEYFHPEFRDITAGRRIWPEVCDAS